MGAVFGPAERDPIQQVSWYDAVLFCNWLSRREGLAACYKRTGKTDKIGSREFDVRELILDANGYRLPNEAEWEYACRAGTVTMFGYGNVDSGFRVLRKEEESLSERYSVFRSSRPEPPGSKLPNGWGLFDMHGNVSEWCQDWFLPYRSGEAVTDPRGPSQGVKRVWRGGSFLDLAIFGRSDYRTSVAPGSTFGNSGIRVARTYP